MCYCKRSYPSVIHLKLKSWETLFALTYFLVIGSFWKFSQNTTVLKGYPIFQQPPWVLCNIWYPFFFKFWFNSIYDIRSKLILKSDLVKSCLPIIYLSVIQSFWNFTQSTAMILPCSVQNFKKFQRLKWMLWTNKISRNLSLTHWGRVTHICVSKLSILGSDQATSHYLNQGWNIVNWTLKEQTSVKFELKFKYFHSGKCIWKCRLENGGHLVSASMC